MKCAKGDTASGKESHIPFCNTTFCTTASAIVCKYVIRQPEQQEGMGGIENIEEIFCKLAIFTTLAIIKV